MLRFGIVRQLRERQRIPEECFGEIRIFDRRFAVLAYQDLRIGLRSEKIRFKFRFINAGGIFLQRILRAVQDKRDFRIF